jgi:UDP-glucose 4-epimerase
LIKVLITGSNGFLGRNLYKYLNNKKKYLVRGIDLVNSDYNMDLSALNKSKYDILEDQIQKADVVFHFAASVGVDNINIVNSYNIDNNILKLFEFYKCKVIYSSSSEVYGSQNKPLKETSKLKIDSKKCGYPIQKLMTEQLLKSLNIPHTIIRFFNIIGPGQNPHQGFVIPRFIKSALSDKPIEVYQPESVRCFMDIRDVLPVLEKLIKSDIDIINIGNPKNEINMLELARMVKYITKSKSKIKIVKKRKNEIKNRIPNVDKMKELYKCKYSLRYTLENIIKAENE